ncbi:hypothetical protein CHELA40_15309 [Chelatococcus asaccharovorans]|nr:hypothetical protein CHELA17_60310 [Chelatococcus asaccharovorans]CAH1682129.1 hypothetical protein CHELA40_15309 [Chelatococcus asaccharovorans]
MAGLVSSTAACSPPDFAGARPPSPEGRDQRGLHPFSSPSCEGRPLRRAFRRLLPFHDVAIGHAVIARAPVGGAACRIGLVEMAQDQTGLDERLHVARQGPVPVPDADAAPRHPFGAVVEIVADHEARFRRWVVPMAGCGEAVEIDDDEAAAGLEHTGHFTDGCCRVRDVDQREIADDEVKRAVGERQGLGISLTIIAGGIPAPGFRQHRLGWIEADGADAAFLQHAAEAALAAADIEGLAVAAPLDPLQDGPVGHTLAGEIAMLAHVGDPGGRRFSPSL